MYILFLLIGIEIHLNERKLPGVIKKIDKLKIFMFQPLSFARKSIMMAPKNLHHYS
tara:strand:+ start:6247 stop:6414 length:168 start_codon:yes stop_codon:yes gene_type:complete